MVFGCPISWRITPESVAVHLNQLGFAANLVESFSLQNQNKTPTTTPYCSKIPINAIAPWTDNNDNSFSQIHNWDAYQSLISSIGWLLCSTHPNLTAVHSFLSSYSNKPSSSHMKAAFYALHYIHSAHGYKILLTSDDIATMHSYIHFTPPPDVEAYNNAIPPKLGSSSTLFAYSNACWALQIGLAIANGTLLPLFKFQSMNSGIVFKNGCPIGWLGERQEQTLLSSCKAEICATNTTITSKKNVDFHNLLLIVSKAGHSLPVLASPTTIFNDNQACVNWSHNIMSKAPCHIKLPKNSIREWIQDKTLFVCHVIGKTDPADIFTKEMHDGAHFCHL